jgi:hypothetical protein
VTVTILSDEHPTARKTHQCDICGGVIGIGDRYHRQRGIFDGDPYTSKGHHLCVKANGRVRRDLDLVLDESPDPDEVMPLVRQFFDNVTDLLRTALTRAPGLQNAAPTGSDPS